MQVARDHDRLYIPDVLATDAVLRSLSAGGFHPQTDEADDVRGMMVHPRYWFVLHHRLSGTTMSPKVWCRRGKLPPLQTRNDLDAIRLEYLAEDMREFCGVNVEPVKLQRFSLHVCVATRDCIRRRYEQDFRNYDGASI